jgi:nucleoid DNA-binding protein
VTKKDLIREIRKYAKANGVKITKTQVAMVLEAFREVSLDACREGDRVVLRNFITIKGVLTKATKLPNGTISEPRLKIKVAISEILKENFRIEMKEKKDKDKDKEKEE